LLNVHHFTYNWGTLAEVTWRRDEGKERKGAIVSDGCGSGKGRCWCGLNEIFDPENDS